MGRICLVSGYRVTSKESTTSAVKDAPCVWDQLGAVSANHGMPTTPGESFHAAVPTDQDLCGQSM